MRNLFCLGGLLLLAACGRNSDAPSRGELLLRTDVDALAGWVPDAQLAHERAHSGRYSLWVDASHTPGLQYQSRLDRLSNTRFTGVLVTYWVYIPNHNARATLVIEVKDEAGTTLQADQIDLQEQVQKFGRWARVSKEMRFPATATYSSTLHIGLVHTAGPNPTYLDDLEVTALR